MPIRNRLNQRPEAHENKSITNVAPLDFFLVGNLTDGEGQTVPSRTVCRVRGTKKFFFPFAKGVEATMRSAAPWLQKELEDRIDGKTETGPDDLGKMNVPGGSPL